ncbi:MAG: RraA family protein [Patescibacteria group bacterium]|nr:RraA family protein [Patescibacteria group bacterium]
MKTTAPTAHFQRIVTRIRRPSKEIIRAISECDSAFLSDFMGKRNVMTSRIKPLSPTMTFCGSALTCLSYERLVRRMAINLAQPGDVLILAAGGSMERSCFGGTTAKQMAMKGMVGIVIDGSTRDAAEIMEIGFPTFVRGVTPINYHYPSDAVRQGGVNVPVICGGVLVFPGDVVKGDADGVVVIPKKFAEKYGKEARLAYREKKRNRAQQKQFTPFPVKDELKELGYRFE